MKRYHKSLFHPAATLAGILLLMLGACTPDTLDELPAASGDDADTRPLAIMVSDGGHHPTGQTRAAERDFRTVFTEGDRIGLYTVKDGQVEKSNLCLTLKGGAWTLPADVPELVHSPARSYYAYYPYKDDSYMNGKVSPGNDDFFALLASNWETKSDQSTYAYYTASDLMTARGTCTPAANGAYTLHFAMEHRMILVVLQAPITKYVYTETIGGRPIEKSYLQYIGMKVSHCWQENSYTARHLLRPEEDASIRIPYSYYTSSYSWSRDTQSISVGSVSPGQYKLINIDDGKLTESNRPLRQGDFYMKGGTVLPQEAFENKEMPREIKDDCFGVVFWVKDPTQTDPILLRDHPACVHGLVLALKKSPSPCVWSNTKETVDIWTNAPERGEDQVSIQQVNSAKGYANTKALRAYNVANPNKKVVAAEVAAQYPASSPEGSSGWFLPDLEDVIKIRKNFTDLENSIEKAGGDLSSSESYWSCFEMSAERVTVLYGNIPSIVRDKNNTHYVRAVLAF